MVAARREHRAGLAEIGGGARPVARGLAGTPTKAGAYSVTATATETNGAHGAVTFGFQVYG
ncbi:MAG TPA: hypothetical protein VGL33_20175 [Streptosporangiaceae bacterium]